MKKKRGFYLKKDFAKDATRILHRKKEMVKLEIRLPNDMIICTMSLGRINGIVFPKIYNVHSKRESHVMEYKARKLICQRIQDLRKIKKIEDFIGKKIIFTDGVRAIEGTIVNAEAVKRGATNPAIDTLPEIDE